jgi:hypothetical protein
MKKFFAFAALAAAAAGCNGVAGSADPATDGVNGPSAQIPAGASNPADGTHSNPPASSVVGAGCSSSDPNKMCVALKYVAYLDSTGTPTVTQAQAISNVSAMNEIYAQCNIAFQIDEYKAVDAASLGLTYQTANLSELDKIRAALENETTLLIVTTGTWNRSGTLGNTGANAWTNMPGGDVFGAILERPVATYSNIVAHEIGHYLNLDHVSSTSDLMSPIIYDYSTTLTSSQCSTMRSAVNYFWPKMKR